MTVAVVNAFSGPFTGNGTNKVFTFTFEAAAASEVGVLVNSVDQTSGFSVVVNSGGAGGTLTFTNAPANGAVVVVYSNPVFTQLIGFVNAGSFLAETVDEALDRAATRLIYLKDRTDRSLRLPHGETTLALPAAASRASKILGFDVNGVPVMTTASGPTGPAPNLSIGSVAALGAGVTPTATITGTNPNYVLNFGIPAGATGASPNVTIGTVSTLAVGASATATITGTTPNLVLNLGLPTGATGAGSSVAWSQITGTLANQTDLQTALNAKQALNSGLTSLAGVAWAAGTQVPVLTAANTYSLLTVGQAAGNLIDKAAGDALYLNAATAAATYVTAASPDLTGTPTSTTAAAGTATTQIATTAFADRLRDIPAVQKSSSYQFLATDRGGTVSTTAGFTIPSNVQVALGIGTVIEVYNKSASSITGTLGGTGTTLRKHGVATTVSSITLAAYSFGTLRKPATATEWVAVGFS